MRDPETIQREIETVKADVALAHSIMQLQTDDAFRRLQDIFRSRLRQITEAICSKDYDGKIQRLGRLQGQRLAIIDFCKAPLVMQKEIQALSKKGEKLQTELQQALSRRQNYQYQR